MSAAKAVKQAKQEPQVPPPEQRHFFERLPWTTIFIVVVYLIYDKDFFIWSMKGQVERWGIDVDLALLWNFSPAKALARENFYQFTMTRGHMQTAAVGCVLVLLGLMVVLWLFIGEKPPYGELRLPERLGGGVAPSGYSLDKEEDAKMRKVARRRLSWALSLFNSGFLTLAGFTFLQIKAGLFTDPVGAYYYMTDRKNDAFWNDYENVGVVVLTWFACFNILELGWGVVVAPEFLEPLTSYVHHPVFAYVCTFGITGNKVPFGEYLLQYAVTPLLGAQSDGVKWARSALDYTATTPFTTSFLFCMAEELPTFLLALGSVFPQLRTDAAFGITFLLLRLLMHAVILVACPWELRKGVLSLSMFLHLMWFRTWCIKYLPALLGKGSGDDKNKKKNQ